MVKGTVIEIGALKFQGGYLDELEIADPQFWGAAFRPCAQIKHMVEKFRS